MTNYNSTANYIFNLVLQVLVTAYLTREMLLHGRVGWAVALVLINLAAIGINLYIWLNVKKGRFSAQKIKQGRLTILVILLVSLLCLAVVSRTARVSPENPTVSAAIGQIVPQSDKTKCISVKRKGNTTFAEAEKGSRDFSAMAAGWTFAATIKDDAAEEFWAVLEKTELTPHINTFTLTGSGTKFRVLYRLDWADTDAPMLYLGLTADGQIWIFRELVLPQFVSACRVQLAGGSEGFQALMQAYSDILAAHPA